MRKLITAIVAVALPFIPMAQTARPMAEDTVLEFGQIPLDTDVYSTTDYLGFNAIRELKKFWTRGEGSNSIMTVQLDYFPIPGWSGVNDAFSAYSYAEGCGNLVGLKGYRYTNTGIVSNSLTFATDPVGWEPGDVVTVINDTKYRGCVIQSIDGNVVKFTQNLPFEAIVNENQWDSKTAYVIEKPKAGDIDLGISAHASGTMNKALNLFAYVEGFGNSAIGQYAHVEGRNNTADYAAHAEGAYVTASGYRSHAEGWGTTASGATSHAEGKDTTASGERAHAEGQNTTASGEKSHAEGENTTASGNFSHSEGQNTTASANYTHAEGKGTTASLAYAHAEGENTLAMGGASHAEGSATKASGNYSHAEGWQTMATSTGCHSEGRRTRASGISSHVEGGYMSDDHGKLNLTSTTTNLVYAYTCVSWAPPTMNTVTDGGVEITNVVVLTTTSGTICLNEDIGVVTNKAYFFGSHAKGGASHAEGGKTVAIGSTAHAEGRDTVASANYSHAEGYFTKALGTSSHSEGQYTTAQGSSSHAEGMSDKLCQSPTKSDAALIDIWKTNKFSLAKSDGSHSEGKNTLALSAGTHAEGVNTIAQGGNGAHAEGYATLAKGSSSHAEGYNTIANNAYEHAQGKFNKSNSDTIHSIGIGTSDTARTNALEVTSSGTIYILVDGQRQSLQSLIAAAGQSGQTTAIETITTNSVPLTKTGTTIEIPLQDYVRIDELQQGLKFNTMSVTNLTINGRKPSLEGHTHNLWEIPGAEAAATNAIAQINAANDLPGVKAAMIEFLNNFKKPE